MQTVFEDRETRVQVNDSGEIFVQAKQGNKFVSTIRITPKPFYEMSIVLYDAEFKPSSFNGMGGFRVVPNK